MGWGIAFGVLVFILIVAVIIIAVMASSTDVSKALCKCPECNTKSLDDMITTQKSTIASLQKAVSDSAQEITNKSSMIDSQTNRIKELESSQVDAPDYFYLDNYIASSESDIKTISGTAKQCISACQADPKCGAVVRRGVAAPNDIDDCYLKASPLFDTRFKSYIAKRPDSQIFENTVIAAGEYKSLPNISEGQCYNACDGDMKCMSASYNYDTTTCSLKNVTGPTTAQNNTNTYIPSSIKNAIAGCGYSGMTRGFYKLGTNKTRSSFCRHVGDAPNIFPACIIDGVDTPMVQLDESGKPVLDTAGKQVPTTTIGEDGKVFNIETTPHDNFVETDFYCMW